MGGARVYGNWERVYGIFTHFTVNVSNEVRCKWSEIKNGGS